MILRENGRAEATAGIASVLETVPHYPDYGTSQELVSHFEMLAAGAHPGVTVETECIGWQEITGVPPKPLVKSVIELGDGFVLYLKEGHGNELAYRRTKKFISTLACRQPEILRQRGVGKLVCLDGDPVTADLNTWHIEDPTMLGYFTSFRRSAADADWDYPAPYEGGFYESRTAGSKASQEVIHAEHPDLIMPLHNAGVSTYFSYLVNAPFWLAEQLSLFMQSRYSGLPPARADIPSARQLTPGVYELPSWEEVYRSLSPNGMPEKAEDLRYGEHSIHYTRRFGEQEGRPRVAGCIMEAPYFAVEAAADPRPSGMTHKQAHNLIITRGLKVTSATLHLLELIDVDRESFAGELRDEATRYAKAWSGILEADLKRGVEHPDREASIAEVVKREAINSFQPTVPLGMLSNLCTHVRSPFAEPVAKMLRRETDFVKGVLRTREEPPRRLVQAQAGAILLACESLQRAA